MNLKTLYPVATALLIIGIVTALVLNSSTPSDDTVTLPKLTIVNPTKSAQVDPSDKKLVNLTIDSSRVVAVVGEIGSESGRTSEQIKILSAISDKPIYILINSPGGSVLDGALIVSAMEASKAPVYTICMQLCASMAAVIHQHGTKRLMQDRSILMFHPAAGGFQGSFPQMKSRFEVLERYVNKFNIKIASNGKMGLTEFNNRILGEWWLDAEDATAAGFNQGIVSVKVRGPLFQTTIENLNTTKGNDLTKFMEIK